MDDRNPVAGSAMGSTLELADYWAAFREGWWMIGLFALFIGGVVAFAVLQIPNRYVASAVVSPVGDEGKVTPGMGALASIGLPASLSSKVEEIDSVFRSKDLAVRVFSKHDLWPLLLGDRIDPVSGTFRPGELARLKAKLAGKGDPAAGRKPGDWDAIRASRESLRVVPNKKAGTLAISFESLSAEGSARIVGHFLEEAKSRLQEEAIGRAGRNKRFIEEQIAKSYDPLVRDRLYFLYGQEVEREMLAKNREQFGFKIIDSVRVPDRKSRPARAKAVYLAVISASFAAYLALLYRRLKKKTASPAT